MDKLMPFRPEHFAYARRDRYRCGIPCVAASVACNAACLAVLVAGTLLAWRAVMG